VLRLFAEGVTKKKELAFRLQIPFDTVKRWVKEFNKSNT
jgi:hypothetical protein